MREQYVGPYLSVSVKLSIKSKTHKHGNYFAFCFAMFVIVRLILRIWKGQFVLYSC